MKSLYLLGDLLQSDSRASFSWCDADRIRSAYESESDPLPKNSPPPQRHTKFNYAFKRELSPTNAASRRWHANKQSERRKAGLNWRGEPYKNERRTRPIIHPELPAKLYLNHAAYVAAWRAKKKVMK